MAWAWCHHTPCAFCSGVAWAWRRLLSYISESESDPLTRRPVWPVDLSTCWPFRKRTPQGQLRGPPTYTIEMWPIDPFDPLTRRPVDLLEKNPSRAIARSTYIHHWQLPVEMQYSKMCQIRLCKRRLCSCVEWGWRIHNIVESESETLTRRPVGLFEKEPLKGKWEVHVHTPSKSGEDLPKDLGGDREQTHKHTNKRCSNYSMM